jgi:hypothetical protein
MRVTTLASPVGSVEALWSVLRVAACVLASKVLSKAQTK